MAPEMKVQRSRGGQNDRIAARGNFCMGAKILTNRLVRDKVVKR